MKQELVKDKMKLKVNGVSQDIPVGMTLAQLLEHLNINPQRVACEVNLSIVRRVQLADKVLNPGDHIEIIQIIGGG